MFTNHIHPMTHGHDPARPGGTCTLVRQSTYGIYPCMSCPALSCLPSASTGTVPTRRTVGRQVEYLHPLRHLPGKVNPARPRTRPRALSENKNNRGFAQIKSLDLDQQGNVDLVQLRRQLPKDLAHFYYAAKMTGIAYGHQAALDSAQCAKRLHSMHKKQVWLHALNPNEVPPWPLKLYEVSEGATHGGFGSCRGVPQRGWLWRL